MNKINGVQQGVDSEDNKESRSEDELAWWETELWAIQGKAKGGSKPTRPRDGEKSSTGAYHTQGSSTEEPGHLGDPRRDVEE